MAKELILSSSEGLQDHYLEQVHHREIWLLLESGTLSDAQVCCGKRTWKVHRVILCVRSEWFKKALTGPFKETETGIVNITEFEENEVDCLLKYIYTGSINVSRCFSGQSSAIASISILRLGDFFQLKDLCKLARDEFNEHLRIASWFFASKEVPRDCKLHIAYCVQFVHALYQQENVNLYEAFRGTVLALFLSNMHVFAKSKEFKTLLHDIPEFSSDWAIAVTDSMASILLKKPNSLSNMCFKCKQQLPSQLHRVKWAKENKIEHFCKKCFPLPALQDHVGKSSNNA